MRSSAGAPRGRVARATVVGTAAVRASTRKAQLALGNTFRTEEERQLATDAADEDIAKIFFEACSMLRGTALKLAQVLATENELFTPAYREQFAQATHQAVPINRALLRRVIKTELGDWRDHFATFSDEPFAAASLGQVHAATGHSGEPLAVKVQYPGVAEGITSDLFLVKAALAPTRWRSVFESCADELRDRLAEELNYEQEAAHTEWFRERIHNPHVHIPAVYQAHSTDRVLVTERLEGLHLLDWLATGPTQALREHYAQLLVDLFHQSVFELHCIHGDPNFGNYLFRDDGKLGWLDFGCVRTLDSSSMNALRRFYRPQLEDPESVLRIHHEMGVRYHSDVPADEVLDFVVQWSQWISEPYRNTQFNFSRPGYMEQGAALGHKARALVESCNGAFLYFGRAQQGLYRLLQSLGACVRMPQL